MKSLLKIAAAAALLPLIACSTSSAEPDSPSSSSEDLVQVSIPGKTSDTTLKPFQLRRDRPDSLFEYGFVLDTKEHALPANIDVEGQKVPVPKGVSALLITLPEKHGRKYRQDIQISRYLGAQTPQFRNLELKEQHVAFFLQAAKTPRKATHGRKKESSKLPASPRHKPHRREKDDEEAVRSPSSTNHSPSTNKKFESVAGKTLRQLFAKVGRPQWPQVGFGFINSSDAKDGLVQIVSPFSQESRKDLAEKYFSLPYVQGDVHVAVKLQNQLISLTKALERSDKSDPNLVIELEVSGFRKDGSPIFPKNALVKTRSATRSELKKIPQEISVPHFNLFFKFIEDSQSASSSGGDEFSGEEVKKRKPKSHRRRHHHSDSENSQ